jgi:hypothetical protein
MKTTLTLAACLLITVSAFSQASKSGAKATPKKATSQGGGATISPEKSAMLCKAWKLDSVSQFGVTQAASPKEKGDVVTINNDGNYSMIMEGVASMGTWKGNAAPYIYTSAGTPEIKKMYKVLALTNNRLVLEYQTEDLIRVDYTYSLK